MQFVGENLFVDPHFCNPLPCALAPGEGGDYALRADPPCLPWTHPCGERIGAMDLGCDAVSVQSTTWGKLKASCR